MQNLRAFNKISILLDTVIVIINSGFALLTGTASTLVIINAIYLALALIFDKKTVFQKDKFFFLLIFIGFMGITFLVNLDFVATFEYIRFVVLLLTVFYISCKYTTAALIYGFCWFMRISAIVSCLFYLMVTIFPYLPYLILQNAYGANYYTCFLGNIVVIEGFFRNSGPFWEGGMYAALSALWLTFEIIALPKNKNKNLMLMVLGFYAIYTTKSTSGYAYMVLLSILFFSHNFIGKRSLWKELTLAGFGIALFVGVNFYETLLDSLVEHDSMVFGKLASQNASYNDRVYGPLLDFWICAQNIFGVGLGNVTEQAFIYGVRLFKVFLTSRTSTLTFFFATFGVIPGIYVNWLWIKFWLHMDSNNVERILIILLFGFSCTSTPLTSNMIFWLILFAGTTINKQKQVESVSA